MDELTGFFWGGLSLLLIWLIIARCDGRAQISFLFWLSLSNLLAFNMVDECRFVGT
jgi:hypothetical protein